MTDLFSPNDMDLTNSVLDNRASTEREQGVLTPENTQKQKPEEGTSFLKADFLETPNAS